MTQISKLILYQCWKNERNIKCYQNGMVQIGCEQKCGMDLIPDKSSAKNKKQTTNQTKSHTHTQTIDFQTGNTHF